MVYPFHTRLNLIGPIARELIVLTVRRAVVIGQSPSRQGKHVRITSDINCRVPHSNQHNRIMSDGQQLHMAPIKEEQPQRADGTSKKEGIRGLGRMGCVLSRGPLWKSCNGTILCKCKHPCFSTPKFLLYNAKYVGEQNL